jgi:hypothetical protein
MALSPVPASSSSSLFHPVPDIALGDEAAFLSYEQRVIHRMQAFWRGLDGMDNVPVIDISLHVEDLIYREALKKYHLPETANAWTKDECIIYFQDRCEKVLRQLATKTTLNWRKLLEEHAKNPAQILKLILQEQIDRPKPKPTKKPTSTASTTPAQPTSLAIGTFPAVPTSEVGQPISSTDATAPIKEKKPPTKKKANTSSAPKKSKASASVTTDSTPSVTVDSVPSDNPSAVPILDPLAPSFGVSTEEDMLFDLDFDFNGETNPELKDIDEDAWK